jgi:aerobic-type carbon monoxide dehydrogenase small subunit (CoxS/CutS family)
MLAVEADGHEVRSVEGLARAGQLNELQQAFLDKGAAQCGFCIPGQLMAAQALLEQNPDPTVAEVHEALAGNLCRCSGYEQITEAVLAAAEARRP